MFYKAGVVETVRSQGALVCIRAERKGIHKLGSCLAADEEKVFAQPVKQTLFGLGYSGGVHNQVPDDGYAFPSPQTGLIRFILSDFSHQL